MIVSGSRLAHFFPPSARSSFTTATVLRKPTRKTKMMSMSPFPAVRHLCSVRDRPGIVLDCQKLLESVGGLNERIRGPLDKLTNQNTIFPFVFLLGNHSSGKSSFVNYILNRKVQTAGVAPTDDSFTIIAPGPHDVDRDGPAFIGDPDMGFSGLKSFGPTLIHHTHLKVRCDTAVDDFMIVDSPGMIDSPVTNSSEQNKNVVMKRNAMDRGYNFEEVVKWYAERADVILLFFDPDKPGTTGETLSILTNALGGMDHKLHIILNKADQFKKIHDFARAYGSLCWNLSKVINRKDLPRIYTMCLPRSFQAAGSGDQSTSERISLGEGGLSDLEATREDVVKEVLNTPRRREDNDITRLTEKIYLLQMHCKIVDDVLERYQSSVSRNRFTMFFTVCGSIGAAAGAFMLLSSPQAAISIGSAGILGTIGLHLWQRRKLQDDATRFCSLEGPDGLQQVYQRLYARRIADSDEHTADIWRKVKEHLTASLTTRDIEKMDRVKKGDFDLLTYIIEKDIPALRRRAAPLFTVSSQGSLSRDSPSSSFSGDIETGHGSFSSGSSSFINNKQ